MANPDAVVVGSGPNGLSAAIELARAGLAVLVCEASATIGGGTRSLELTLPGFLHDVCSAVHPLAASSPVFRQYNLEKHGLNWIQPPLPLAHPLDDGSAAVLHRDIEETARNLGTDAASYRKLFPGAVRRWKEIEPEFLTPLSLLKHPRALAGLGVHAFGPATQFARGVFQGERARALFLGMAAHSFLPLNHMVTAGFGLVLAIAGHSVGWPIPRGGSQKIADALAAHLRSLGGEIVTGWRVSDLNELPPARAILCDVTPRQFLKLAGNRLPAGFRRALERYRYGMGAFKVDWALSSPIPWTSPDCARAGVVHIGSTPAEIVASEHAAWNGSAAERPFVLLAQPSLFDPSRAPAGKHTAWAYCHVPHASTFDMLERIENQIERFAPGFRDCVLARSVMPPRELERHNPNLVGGDINGGVQDLRQFFNRPTWRLYSTPLKGVYLCSSSTPPGGGVHGMCGYMAAHAALRRLT